MLCHILLRVILKYLQLVHQFCAFINVTPSAQMDSFKEKISLPAEKNRGKKMNQGTQEQNTPSAQIN